MLCCAQVSLGEFLVRGVPLPAVPITRTREEEDRAFDEWMAQGGGSSLMGSVLATPPIQAPGAAKMASVKALGVRSSDARSGNGSGGGSVSNVTSGGGSGGGNLERVTLLEDVQVGDTVLVCPLASGLPPRSAPAGGNGIVHVSLGGERDSLVEGVVEEVIVERVGEDFQPRGVLVRLADDTLGHVVRCTGGGSAGPRGGSAGPGGGSAGPESAGPRGVSAGACRSVGPRGAEAAQASVAEASVESLEVWVRLQKQFGEAICSAVLEDCGASVEEAVAVLEVRT